MNLSVCIAHLLRERVVVLTLLIIVDQTSSLRISRFNETDSALI
jgi:hypothetical protein